MRQAILWTNADPICWRMYALGGDKLQDRRWNAEKPLATLDP